MALKDGAKLLSRITGLCSADPKETPQEFQK